MNQMCLREKYSKFIALLCVIFSTIAVFIVTTRSAWSVYGIIGGVIEVIGSIGLPLIAMIIGSSFIKDDKGFKEFYKSIFIKYIIPLGIYYLVLKCLSLGEFKFVDITSTIIGILLVAPFLKEFLRLLNEKKLKYLVALIFIASIINTYFPLFNINMAIDLSFFNNWVIFCIIGYEVPQIKSGKVKRNIYTLGVISAILTFALRAVPIDSGLLGVSPTMILYSTAVFLWINNLKWDRLEKFSMVSKSIDFINKHRVGIFLTHNFIIINVLNDKFNIHPNRFKVIFGSGIVFVASIILSSIIAVVIDKLISKNSNRLIKWSKAILEKLSNVSSYKHYLIWIASALVVTFISEAFLREGIAYALDFVKFVEHKKFIANFLLVLAVTSPCLLFKRAYMVLAIICEVLIGVSVASYFMFVFRGTPLTYSDFFSIQDGLAIAGQYINLNMLVMAGVFFTILVIINCKLSSIKVRKKFGFSKMSIIVIVVAFIFAKANLDYVVNKGILATVTWDIKYSYNENGFFFSLYDSYKSSKREKPKSYSEVNVTGIKESINDDLNESAVSEENANIILVQLESVMDPYTIDGLQLSDDPMKNIRGISERSSSGSMQVPSFGGGTARSEFEVLTGMSLDYFSSGELPHNSYLKKDSIESLAYVLDSNIYEKTLIHNYQGNFYGRNTAYENLGFERYIPMEYMYNRKFTTEFPEDELVLNNIIETIETTEKRDFVFAIGSQTHGGYDEDYSSDDSEVIVSGNLSQEHLNQIQDYVDDLVMVDRMIGELIQFVDNLDEPTVLAAYSDHLPSLNAVKEQFSPELKYLTPYFIYDNMGSEKVDMDIEAYELSTKILDIVNLPGGVMNKFHRQYKNYDDYQERLEYLQYDILNGKKYIYDKKDPYKRTSIKMGLKDIVIEDVNITENTLEAFGQGFNEYSCIYVDGKSVTTEYISENKLVADISNKKISKIKVHQLSRRSKSIGSTIEYVVQK